MSTEVSGGTPRRYRLRGAARFRRLRCLIALAWGALHLLAHRLDVLPVAARQREVRRPGARRRAGAAATVPRRGPGRAGGSRRPSATRSESIAGSSSTRRATSCPSASSTRSSRTTSARAACSRCILYALGAGLLLRLSDRLIGRRLAWLALALYLLYLPILYYGLGIATEGPRPSASCWLAHALAARPPPAGPVAALRLGLALANLYLTKTTFRAVRPAARGRVPLPVARKARARRASRCGCWSGPSRRSPLWSAFLVLTVLRGTRSRGPVRTRSWPIGATTFRMRVGRTPGWGTRSGRSSTRRTGA